MAGEPSRLSDVDAEDLARDALAESLRAIKCVCEHDPNVSELPFTIQVTLGRVVARLGVGAVETFLERGGWLTAERGTSLTTWVPSVVTWMASFTASKVRRDGDEDDLSITRWRKKKMREIIAHPVRLSSILSIDLLFYLSIYRSIDRSIDLYRLHHRRLRPLPLYRSRW